MFALIQKIPPNDCLLSYKNHLIREFPVSDELPPRWMVAAMRPIDNAGYHSADYMANDQWNSHMEDCGIPSSNEPTPEWMIDAMRPVDYSEQFSSKYDLTASPYKYANKRRELYSPGESSRGTRSSTSPDAGTQFIKTEDDHDDEHSLDYFARSQFIKAEEVKDHRSVSHTNSNSYPSACSSRSLPACKREYDKNGNIAQYDPDVYYGATLLTKMQRGIPF